MADDVEQSISRHLKCPLCPKPFVQSVSVRCINEQQTYCYRCIEEYMNRKDTCPICDCNLELRNVIPVPKGIVTKIFDDLPIKCLKCNRTHLTRSSYFSDHQDKMCTAVDASSLSCELACALNKDNEQSLTIERIQNENEQLKVQLVHQQARADAYKDKNKQLTTEASEKTSKIEILQKDVQTLQGKNRDLMNRLKKQMKMMEEQRNEIRELKIRLDQQQNEYNQTTRRLEELEADRRLQDLYASQAEESSPAELEKYFVEMKKTLNSIKSLKLRHHTIQFTALLAGVIFKLVSSMSSKDGIDDVTNQRLIDFGESAMRTLPHIINPQERSIDDSKKFDVSVNVQEQTTDFRSNTYIASASSSQPNDSTNLQASTQKLSYSATSNDGNVLSKNHDPHAHREENQLVNTFNNNLFTNINVDFADHDRVHRHIDPASFQPLICETVTGLN